MVANWTNKLSNDLNLIAFEQDWGICNSDHERIDEFINYYLENKVEHSWENEAIAELIFQSVEDALEKKTFDLESKFKEFVKNHKADFPNTLKYWLSLDVREWSIPNLLKNIINS